MKYLYRITRIFSLLVFIIILFPHTGLAQKAELEVELGQRADLAWRGPRVENRRLHAADEDLDRRFERRRFGRDFAVG